ncbi:MAG: VOC family protein [Thermoplasmata archaeon]|nr:VOC family protein [Thermoplasmata archaeon]
MGTPGADPLQFYGVRLLVKDFAKSWRFYRDVLGLTPNKGHGQPPYGEFLSKNRSVVSIFDRKLMATAVGLAPGRYAATATGRAALVFEVTDVDATARRLRQRKVRLLQGPTDRPDWRLRTIHLRDPDGYLIEIYSPMVHEHPH